MATTTRVIIEAKKGWQVIDWQELVEYRDLFYFLVRRDIRVVYRQTVLGFGWAILQPVFNMIVFSVVFGRLAKMPSDGIPYPLFSYIGLVPWTYFSNAMTLSTQSLVANSGMLSKVYFPRLAIPLTPVFAKLADFMIALSIAGVLMLWYRVPPTWNVVFLPLLILLMVVTAASVGMWFSALAIQYRDVRFAMTFISQILMYAAPVAWPVSLVPEQYRLLYALYPMVGVIEGFRSALLGTTPMPWDMIGIGMLSAVVLAVSGMFYFRRMERIFADVA